MLFHTWQFWGFFAIVLLAFYSVPFRVGRIVLLIASYAFYMAWNWRFAALILGSTVLDYVLGIAIAPAPPRRRRILVVLSVVANLGVLGFFKYYNFFSANVAAALGLPANSFLLNLVLPVGISFYTFKSMSYTVDVYRGHLPAVRNFLDYAIFVVFFPELVAGPIVRADVFFPQYLNWKKPDAPQVQEAIALILNGLIKKMVFADRFALISDEYFAHLQAHPGPAAAWSGVLAFTAQIFFDFSGYTDIARGCALLLGIRFPLNFRRPYLAPNITEFWRRWHMSLSEWLRDYLYIPLGGNRHGRFNTYRNLMLTMLLGGLWHGASWNFVVWGGIHGMLLSVHRLLARAFSRTRFETFLNRAVFVPAKVGLTFFTVVISWVFFRAQSFADAGQILSAMFTTGPLLEGTLWTKGTVALAVSSTILAVAEEKTMFLTRLSTTRFRVRLPLYASQMLCLELFAVTGVQIPFIYFQF